MVSSTLYEISWEVCNKVGGIYTVLESKSRYAKKNFKNYILLGPYLNTSKNYFFELPFPKKYLNAKLNLEKKGIKIYYGYTHLNVNVPVMLVDFMSFSNKINTIKYLLWEHFSIDSLHSNWYDYDQAMLWSWTCGMVLEELEKNNKHNSLVHVHEWMSSGALFYFKIHNLNKFKTIFTTHATILGRSIASSGRDLYKAIEQEDLTSLSYQLGVHTKHQTEVAAAHTCNCFTTVSDITNEECLLLYNKKADYILYNGFDNHSIKNIESISKQVRKKLLELSKQKDTSNCYFFYTSGRNETRDKGYDVYIKALYQLNEKLKNENFKGKIINFLLIIIGDYQITREYWYSPYNIKSHEIISLLEQLNFKNEIENPIQNILIPVLLDSNKNIFGFDYYNLISGFDLGVFPSYYEPWGLTPLESIAYHVPSITTDLTGFGRSLFKNDAVKVLKRNTISEDEFVNVLSEELYSYLKLSKREQEFRKKISAILAKEYDWSLFYNNYLDAYSYALDKK
jgi:phosphorylase/glycogen(starch) synthase